MRRFRRIGWGHWPAGRLGCAANALPALLVDELVERQPAAGAERTCEVGRIGRVAEREQVFTMMIGRVAEQGPGEILLVSQPLVDGLVPADTTIWTR